MATGAKRARFLGPVRIVVHAHPELTKLEEWRRPFTSFELTLWGWRELLSNMVSSYKATIADLEDREIQAGELFEWEGSEDS